MQRYDFQDLVADLLRGMSYRVSWVAPPGKGGGIDIVAYTDPPGIRPIFSGALGLAARRQSPGAGHVGSEEYDGIRMVSPAAG